jgi:hypothetical protein
MTTMDNECPKKTREIINNADFLKRKAIEKEACMNYRKHSSIN